VEQVSTQTERVSATDLSKDILLPVSVWQLKKEVGSDWKKIINLSSRGKVEIKVWSFDESAMTPTIIKSFPWKALVILLLGLRQYEQTLLEGNGKLELLYG
jgi:hypothetical protein